MAGMTWRLFGSRTIASEKNGAIVVSRHFGRPIVTVNSYFQTGVYIDRMWRRAWRRIPRRSPIKRVLVLGYGAGGMNRLICRRFPHARITAVEWDPAMVALAHELKLHRADALAELRLGDAAQVVHELTGTFDLIVFDLYCGREPSPLIEDARFLSRLQQLTALNG